MEIQAFGAGIQSVALAILNATGRVTPPADLALFADPGSEDSATYELLPLYRDWMAKRGLELVTVASNRGPLLDFLYAKSTVIPVTSISATGKHALRRRQCTHDWKILPIEQEMRRRLGIKRGTPWTTQFGISIDEIQRARVEPSKRYPLIELMLSRADCRRIIEDAGLPIPPKSSCTFCPYQTRLRWQRRAVESPETFEAACRLEDRLREREPNVYINYRAVTLRNLVSTAQLSLDDALEEAECTGYCFV